MAHPLSVTLLASTQLIVTGAGASAAVDLVAADVERGLARRLLRVTLKVSAPSGSNPTLDIKIQTSLDGTSGWTDVTDGAFARMTGEGFAVRLVAPVERYVRVHYTLGGTLGPSFTAEVKAIAEAIYADPTDFAQYGLPGAAGFEAQAVRYRLLSATGRCNALIVKQHKLPLVPPYPPELAEACCQIAGWRLLEHRGFDPESEADAAVKEAHDDALKWLENWGAGAEQPEVIDDTPDVDDAVVAVSSEPSRGWTAF